MNYLQLHMYSWYISTKIITVNYVFDRNGKRNKFQFVTFRKKVRPWWWRDEVALKIGGRRKGPHINAWLIQIFYIETIGFICLAKWCNAGEYSLIAYWRRNNGTLCLKLATTLIFINRLTHFFSVQFLQIFCLSLKGKKRERSKKETP